MQLYQDERLLQISGKPQMQKKVIQGKYSGNRSLKLSFTLKEFNLAGKVSEVSLYQ